MPLRTHCPEQTVSPSRENLEGHNGGGGLSGIRRLGSCQLPLSQLSINYIFNNRGRHAMGRQLRVQAATGLAELGTGVGEPSSTGPWQVSRLAACKALEHGDVSVPGNQ